MKMRVCIIDDDHLVSLSLKTILEADGQVEIVGIGSSGEDAIRFYEEKKTGCPSHGHPHGGDDRTGSCLCHPKPGSIGKNPAFDHLF